MQKQFTQLPVEKRDTPRISHVRLTKSYRILVYTCLLTVKVCNTRSVSCGPTESVHPGRVQKVPSPATIGCLGKRITNEPPHLVQCTAAGSCSPRPSSSLIFGCAFSEDKHTTLLHFVRRLTKMIDDKWDTTHQISQVRLTIHVSYSTLLLSSYIHSMT